MLQFICAQGEKYSQPEQAQMAIEGGCTWIQLRMPEGYSTDYLREVGDDLVAMCRDASAFLIFENMPEEAREMGVHGVHLTGGGVKRASEVREMLGPEAVVGVELATLAEIDAARAADIDYVSLPPTMSMERAAELIASVRAAGNEMPIVACGDINVYDIPVIKAAGFSGVAVGNAIAEASDPVSATEEFIIALTND